jgi:hypothetical protein
MVRPGITDWAQVNGGILLTPGEKEVLDEWYNRGASVPTAPSCRPGWRCPKNPPCGGCDPEFAKRPELRKARWGLSNRRYGRAPSNGPRPTTPSDEGRRAFPTASMTS